MSFHSQEDDVGWPRFFERTNNSGLNLKISFRAFDVHSVLLHGSQMGPTREERDIQSSSRHARTDVSANGSGSGDQEFHAWLSTRAAATARRRIFPVGVVGMLGAK